MDVPEWVDESAARARERLTTTSDHVRIGHGDWEPQNILWAGRAAVAVHDWDSVIAQPEAAIVGLAAAMWPRADGSDHIASLEQTGDFIASYQRAIEREWDASRVRLCA